MRLYEFNDAGVSAHIIGLLTHLKKKAEGKAGARVRTDSFLRMLSNLGVTTDVNGLEQMKMSNPAIGRFLGDITDEKIELNLTGEPTDFGMDDFDMGAGDEEFDDLDMGAEDEMGGPTTADFEQPEEMDMGDTAKSLDTTKSMAKRALARRQ